MLQVYIEMTNPQKHVPGVIGEHLQTHIENELEASVNRLSVRDGLAIGCRELPTGQIEPLSARLAFILDFLTDADNAGNGCDDMDSAMTELQELIADVKKAEGEA